MAFSLKLPPPLAKEGWKIKIRDRERLEPPHVTIFHKRRVWRLGLRDRQVLDPLDGNKGEIDPRVEEVLREKGLNFNKSGTDFIQKTPFGARIDSIMSLVIFS